MIIAHIKFLSKNIIFSKEMYPSIMTDSYMKVSKLVVGQKTRGIRWWTLFSGNPVGFVSLCL